MDYKEIEQLLQRYWLCETSVEEEERLYAFFNGQDVPQCWERYKDLFAYRKVVLEEHLGSDFDERLLARIKNAPSVKARRVTLISRLSPLLKAAAVVAIAVITGGVVQHSFLSDVQEITACDTIGNQITAPSVAQSGGESTATVDEQQLPDSLQQVKKLNEPLPQQQ